MEKVRYSELFRGTFRGLFGRDPKGEDEATLAETEGRLGVALPAPLRGFLLACGSEKSVMSSHNHFRAPESMEVVDGRLAFCDENQGACVWACEPGSADPFAEVGNVLPDNTLEWRSEEVGLSRFLEIMLYLQTAWGGFEYAGDLQDPGAAMKRLESEWDRVVRHNGLTIYGRPGALISVLDGDGFLIGAARTEAAFNRLRSELGLSPF